jgi:hypothetical protein
MSTDKGNEQEAPGVHTSAMDDDTEGHVHTANTEDSERGSKAPNSRFLAKDEEDDTEGHVRTAMSSDPDFGAQPPSKRAS